MGPIRTPRRRRSAFEPLTIKSVDLLKDHNQAKHFTADYETNELVIRRGFPFSIMITLSRELKSGERLNFDLRFGRQPRTSRGSLVKLPWINSDSKVEAKNGVKLLSLPKDIVMTIEVHTSAETTGVGQWYLVMTPHYRRRHRNVLVTEDIIILFNPWEKTDPVYMSEKSWRNEYVLNENGLQFYGTTNRIGQMDWYFGQFEAPVMKACLKLLDMDRLMDKDRGDPVMVSRHMSGMVNSNDNDGVLVGNWSDDFSGGKEPTYWNGSVAILKQFVDTGKPVEFGQCWVFSGILTTVLRCLGIPARSLTTFESAHDTDGNLTIDYHFDKNGKPMDNDDSIWNFHVWNDAWMTRPVLPEGFGGWQAVDATPQEESQGKFQCGPASVSAVKEGQIGYAYDAPFLYAEVNGSKVYWRKLKSPERTADGKAVEWENLGSDVDLIGQHISTKAIGTFKREDITNSYKYPEGSPEERISFTQARKFVKFTKVERKDVTKVIDFDARVPDSVSIGQPIVIKLHIRNVSKKSQKLFIGIVGRAVQYNGSVLGQLFDNRVTREIPPSKTEDLAFTLAPRDYLNSIRGNNVIKFTFMGGVEGQRQTFVKQAAVEFDKPRIAVEAAGLARLNKRLKIKFSFVNPLSVPLTNGVFHVEGAGVRDAVAVPVSRVQANGTCQAEVSVLPRKKGVVRIIAGFTSPQLDGLKGSLDISVA